MTAHPTITKFSIACSFIFALTIVNIFLSMRSIQVGASISSLEHQKVSLQREKTTLNQKVAQRNSLHTVAELAKSEGFTPISKTVTIRIPSDSSVALR